MTDDHAADERAIEYLETGAVDLEPQVAADLDAVRAELADAAARTTAPQAAPTPHPPGAAGPSDSIVALADARARRARALAVVASVVAAAAVVVAVVGFASRPPATTSESASGPTGTTTVRASDRRTIGPGVEAPLNATDLVPGAAGTVRLDETDSGVWIRMDASGLPRRDDGAFYQAWVKTPQGLVPIGTFHTGDDVVLWSGIPIADTDAVTVTLEENDGNQESSGQRVLVATIPHPGSAGRPGTTGTNRTTGTTGSSPSSPATSPR